MNRPRPTGKTVPVPQDVRDHVLKLSKTKGAVPALCRRAGLRDAYLFRLSKGLGKGLMNEHALARVQAAIRGERLPKKPKANDRPKGKALQRHEHAVGAVIMQPPNGHAPTMESDRRELKKLLDGLTLGVEITRRTVLESLGMIH